MNIEDTVSDDEELPQYLRDMQAQLRAMREVVRLMRKYATAPTDTMPELLSRMTEEDRQLAIASHEGAYGYKP